MTIYTKESLIQRLCEIRDLGWIKNTRPGNVGGIGNTLEDLLGIQENNLPLPNAAEWELKCQRADNSSLITLFHMEPSPRTIRFVPRLLLPKYGWAHEGAGTKHPENEMSFRQTIHALSHSDRGFKVVVDRSQRKVMVSFDVRAVAPHHSIWLDTVARRVGLGELEPQPYWGFDDLFHKAGTKLLNCFYVLAQVRGKGSGEEFHYRHIFMLSGFRLERFITAIESGSVLVDFDARTNHNHGTKFRVRPNVIFQLYEEVNQVG